MQKSLLSSFFLAVCAVTSLSIRCNADIIIDNFENQSVSSGAGTPLDYFSFGDQLADRGVTNLFGATSGFNAAFYAIDFDQSGFGVGAAHQNLNLSISSDNAISVNLRFASGVQSGGFVGFRLTDADGTIVRTANADLFSASGSFQTIVQLVSGINSVDGVGTTAGLDVSQITSVGLLFFDQGFSGTSLVAFDDLKITSVPEPSSLGLLLATISIAAVHSRRRVSVAKI